jgi:hypothetical protein
MSAAAFCLYWLRPASLSFDDCHHRTREVPALLPLFALNICRVCASFSIVGVVACPCLACGGAAFV